MIPPRVITVFGATGNQGSGIINTVLAVPAVREKYTLRGVTRDPEGPKRTALSQKGVELVKADLNDLDSLKAAIRGSYGVFGMTDFWSIHSKEVEVQQGKNLFEACKAEGVQHFVYSSLPWATKTTNGILRHLEHFDSKAMVQEFIEAHKGDMIASYFRPAMFLSFLPNLIRKRDGTPTMILPFPSDSISWPFIDPPQDGGKYVLGLFEGGSAANGVQVNAVSCWTTPKELASALTKDSGREVALEIVDPETFAREFPENIAAELTETLRIVGEFSVYGRNEEQNLAKHDKWLVEGLGRS
ncbi:NmrA/HSCARG family protein [Aspergillus alliaceus]|uniref:NmrA/HSCARG family protein n=1 Tax=Petromyces alliaceus TaxID=209559 RepID=UPI0012A48DC5|nr:uncharacterized protein BDW43DRAFT_318331 [Aspergillus alliaceus]KAB8235413.1 hypothetical protein BDW43DRAFT_318331 [Aspergillus alliaceus]